MLQMTWTMTHVTQRRVPFSRETTKVGESLAGRFHFYLSPEEKNRIDSDCRRQGMAVPGYVKAEMTYPVSKWRFSEQDHIAVHSLPAAVLRLMAELGPQKPPVNPQLVAAMHRAAQTGDVAKVRALLASDANLLASKDSNGNVPLTYAARVGSLRL